MTTIIFVLFVYLCNTATDLNASKRCPSFSFLATIVSLEFPVYEGHQLNHECYDTSEGHPKIPTEEHNPVPRETRE